MALPSTYQAVLVQLNNEPPKICDVPLVMPEKNQVLIKIEYGAIHPADTMVISGDYPVPLKRPHPVGFEGSGVVVAVGDQLKVPHTVGERVSVSGPGTWGQYILVDSESCRKLPDDISFEDGALFFANPATTICLANIAQKGNHKAAIHTAGSSAVGRMMIRYFKHRGIKLINIVRNDKYIEELKAEGADYVLNSTDKDFEAKLKEIAEKEEATISFEAVAGNLTSKILANQPDDSICYLYGGLEGEQLKGLNVGDFIFQGKTLSGFWIGKYLRKNMSEIPDIFKDIAVHAKTCFKPQIYTKYKLTDLEKALADYHVNSSKGKILLQP